MAGKPYIYITLVMRVREDKSFSRLVSMIKDNEPRIQLVDYSEDNRRIVVRVPAREVAFAQRLAAEYGGSVTYDVKATIKAKVQPKRLREIGAVYRPGKPGTILFYLNCEGDAAVYGEVKGREVMVKLCRRTLQADPSALPPGLCSFTPEELDMADAIEKARRCFNSLLEKLSSQQGRGDKANTSRGYG
jgi:hypothetical protein